MSCQGDLKRERLMLIKDNHRCLATRIELTSKERDEFFAGIPRFSPVPLESLHEGAVGNDRAEPFLWQLIDGERISRTTLRKT